MKKKILFSIVLVAGLMFTSFSVSPVYNQAPQDKPSKAFAVKYTCPMHAEILENAPGVCPKCGMELVEKKVEFKEGKPVIKDSIQMKDKHMKHDHMKMKSDSTKMKI
jgi:hypothetical protein